SYENMNIALDKLNMLGFSDKKKFLVACIKTAAYDRKITLDEAELIRLISISLECPMPNLFLEAVDTSEIVGMDIVEA
ncbi:MAG: hypothetical protein HQK54_09395, partial [Oligoflexales bacterium]|nr:hypothetical protein [Oligoflexales bacterium]